MHICIIIMAIIRMQELECQCVPRSTLSVTLLDTARTDTHTHTAHCTLTLGTDTVGLSLPRHKLKLKLVYRQQQFSVSLAGSVRPVQVLKLRTRSYLRT